MTDDVRLRLSPRVVTSLRLLELEQVSRDRGYNQNLDPGWLSTVIPDDGHHLIAPALTHPARTAGEEDHLRSLLRIQLREELDWNDAPAMVSLLDLPFDVFEALPEPNVGVLNWIAELTTDRIPSMAQVHDSQVQAQARQDHRSSQNRTSTSVSELDLRGLDAGHLVALTRALHEARFGGWPPEAEVASSPLVVDMHVAALAEQRRRDEASGSGHDWDSWLKWRGRSERSQVVGRLSLSAALRDAMRTQPSTLRSLLRPFEVDDDELTAMINEADDYVSPRSQLAELIRDVQRKPGMFLSGQSCKDYVNFVTGVACAAGLDWGAFHTWLQREVLQRPDSRAWPYCLDREGVDQGMAPTSIDSIEDPVFIQTALDAFVTWVETGAAFRESRNTNAGGSAPEHSAPEHDLGPGSQSVFIASCSSIT